MDALLICLLLTLAFDQGSTVHRHAARLNAAGTPNARAWGSLALLVAINAITAAALGGIMAALLMPNARLLFLAIALLMGGLGLILSSLRKAAPSNNAPAHDAPVRNDLRTWLVLAARRAGENGAFAVAGVVAFTDAPIFAAIGTMMGGWVALLPPLLLGNRYSRHVSLRVFQLLSGVALLCAAIGCAANALRIV